MRDGRRGRRVAGNSLDVSPERELCVDPLLLEVGRIKDEHAGSEAHGQGKDDDGARGSHRARGQGSTRELAPWTEQATQGASQATATPEERSDHAQEQQGSAGPEEKRRHERRQREGDRRVPFCVQDRMDPRASRENVDQGARDERQDIQVEALPQRSTVPLQLLAAEGDLLTELSPQRQDGRKGRQDRGQDDRDCPTPEECLGRSS